MQNNKKGVRGSIDPNSLRNKGVRLTLVNPSVRDLLAAIAANRGGTKADHIENALIQYAKPAEIEATQLGKNQAAIDWAKDRLQKIEKNQSDRCLDFAMEFPDRNESIAKQIKKLFRLIDARQLKEAKSLRQHLGAAIGDNDPQLVTSDVLIRRYEILKENKESS